VYLFWAVLTHSLPPPVCCSVPARVASTESPSWRKEAPTRTVGVLPESLAATALSDSTRSPGSTTLFTSGLVMSVRPIPSPSAPAKRETERGANVSDELRFKSAPLSGNPSS